MYYCLIINLQGYGFTQDNLLKKIVLQRFIHCNVGTASCHHDYLVANKERGELGGMMLFCDFLLLYMGGFPLCLLIQLFDYSLKKKKKWGEGRAECIG